jgi:GntR family transcriptional regulator
MQPQQLKSLIERFLRPGLPKYLALRDAVNHAVASGATPPGWRLPAEHELARLLPMSLGTVQRGLRQLAEERVITRTPGAGSFIAAHHHDAMAAPFHCRFLRDDGQGYLPVFAQIVSRALTDEPGPWSEHLGTARTVRIVRRIRVADEFSVCTIFYADAQRMPVFAQAPVKKLSAQNFKEVIWRSAGQSTARIDLFVSQQPCPAEVAAVIGVKAKAMCLDVEARAFFGRSDPAYYQRIVIPPSRRKLHVVTDGRERGMV